MSNSRIFLTLVAAMAVIVTASNFLVQYPFHHFGLGEILTWGAFTYPVAFLVTDLANRRFGTRLARPVVYTGFAFAVLLSLLLASPRIAIASGTAFIVAQLIDIYVFNKLREQAWWRAPFISTMFGSVIDTIIFFSLAFAATFAFLDTGLGREDGSLAFSATLFGLDVPLWVSLGFGDFCVKVLIGLAMLVPYGALLPLLMRPAFAGRGK